MTNAEKLEVIKTLLDDGGEVPSDAKLSAYLQLSEDEILSWMYRLVGGVPSGVSTVPDRYNSTQIYAVVAGYTHAGSEGQKTHNENGINRVFTYSDMVDYIHQNVTAIARVG